MATRTKPQTMVAAVATKYPMQICYLKRVDQYVNSATSRALKIKWLVQEKFNGVIMYGIDGVINPSYYTGLHAFIRELKAAGIKYAAMAYSNDSVKSALNAFQDSSLTMENFDKIMSEIEPWVSSSGITWAEYFRRISSMHTWAQAEADTVDTMTYQGWINKPTGTTTFQNAANTIRYANKICLHDYTYPEPNPGYGLQRYKDYGSQLLALGYSAINKKVFMPIYSAEQDFSQIGFKTKAPVDYYSEFITYMDRQTFPGKECMDYKQGFLVFKDTDLMVARPLK